MRHVSVSWFSKGKMRHVNVSPKYLISKSLGSGASSVKSAPVVKLLGNISGHLHRGNFILRLTKRSDFEIFSKRRRKKTW